jgi:membrane fusion protein (multidrug efflux system)
LERVWAPGHTSEKIKKIRIFLWTAAIAAGLVILALRITDRAERSAATLEIISQNIQHSRPVTVMKLESSDWDQWRKYYGEAQSASHMEVASFVREVVEAVHVDVGDKIAEGQILISLRQSDQATEGKARAAVYEESKTTYNRLLALNKAGGVSRAEVDRAHTAMISEQAALQNNRSALGRTQLRSKISGIVTERRVEPGEVAEMGQVLLTIEDISEIEAILMVSARDIGGIGVKTPVNVIHNGVQSKAAVRRVSPRAQSGSGLYPVTVKLDPKSGVLPGAHVEGDFLVSRMPGAIVIPSSAVFNRGDEQFVYVAVPEDGERAARMVKIRTGGGADGKVVATSGIASGDLLIVSGGRGLSDGVPVSFKPAKQD